MFKKSLGDKVFDIFNMFLMVFFMVITIYPMLFVVFASLSDPLLLTKFEGLLFRPLGQPTLKGFEITLRNPNIINGYRNTVLYVVLGTLINLFMTFCAAYILSRKDFYIKRFMTVMIIITMYFSGGLIPMFFVIRSLHMYDTIWTQVIPGAISAYNMIIMRTFFMQIPDSFEESAIIDGANDIHVLIKIILPLSKPIIAVMVLYYGVSHWNSWFNAMVFLRDRKLFPLQLFLREVLVFNESSDMVSTSYEFLEESYHKELVKYCTILVSTVPILCIYPFLQKYFVKGVMIGGLKG